MRLNHTQVLSESTQPQKAGCAQSRRQPSQLVLAGSKAESEYEGLTTRKNPTGLKRRACRTSENERPHLDGQYDVDIDIEPHLPPVLRIRNRSSRCENVLERLAHRTSDICIIKQFREQGLDCSEPDEIICLPHPLVEEETVEVAACTTPQIVESAAVIDEDVHEHALATSSSNRRRPKLVRSPTLDRFLLPRKPLEHMRDLMHMGKKASELTARQKLLRNTDETHPFATSIRLRNRSIDYVRTQRTQRQLRAQARQHSRVLGQRHDTIDNAIAGNSTVWDANGSTSSVRAAARAPARLVDVMEPNEESRTFTSDFLYGPAPADQQEVYENRLALALGVDRMNRLIDLNSPFTVLRPIRSSSASPEWKDNAWFHNNMLPPSKSVRGARQTVPSLPFRVLEAPGLRDDFYCSALAYCPTINCLAVALGVRAYLWSESLGVIQVPRQVEVGRMGVSYITSLAFSSAQGGRAILTIARGNGQISMYSQLDTQKRFLYMSAPTSVTHLSFRPKPVKRPSQRHSNIVADNEVLLAGDDAGVVSIYFVEWPSEQDRWMYSFHGAVTLHARIAVHNQQICGIAWSIDGGLFATGGNDNLCCTYSMRAILNMERQTLDVSCITRHVTDNIVVIEAPESQTTDILMGSEDAKHIWNLNAAVKAIAFCPWQIGLVAAGGGSNDRCIHFFSTLR